MQILSLREIIAELEYYEDVDINIDEDISVTVSNGFYEIKNSFNTDHVSDIKDENVIKENIKNMLKILRQQTKEFLCKIEC